MEITSLAFVKRTLNSHHLFPLKKWGQNFLVDKNVVAKMVTAAEFAKSDKVIEIGAGLGALTVIISPLVKKIWTHEIDKNLIPILQESVKVFDNVKIINQDILATSNQQPATKIIGSIPYQITSPLIHKILLETKNVDNLVLLIQKEVAEKICSQPPRASYLSNFVALFGKAQIVKTVKPKSFYPQPKVDSAILKIKLFPKRQTLDAKRFSKFLHHGFSSPRKMLNKKFNKKLLERLGINPQKRPGELELKEWVKLFNQM